MDSDTPRNSGQGFHTRLSHAGRAGTHAYGFVNPAVHRGSTVLFPTMAARIKGQRDGTEQEMTYGLNGGPTHYPLENIVAEIEGGLRAQIVSSGLAAITTALLAFVKAGDHILVTDSIYGPGRSFCDGMLARLGVRTTYYDPTIEPAALDALFQPTTTLLYTESPGSQTFEVQDIPGLAAAAHARGAKLLMDNTWGIHFFQPFRHGVDVSIQALTKYVGGHSDLMLGAVTVNDADDFRRVRDTALELGQFASPDDCWLALRGARTLGVRLDRQMRGALDVASWLAGRPEVLQVLYPALPGAPGHALWKRDFSGACSLFGLVLRPEFGRDAVYAMTESLQLFGMGASWGGFESLALPTTRSMTRTAGSGRFGGEMMRLHVGLEDPADLIADLEQGLAVLRATPSDAP
jgi:cystathionine beta-lyase